MVLNLNKTGLAFGIFLAILHALWALMVLVMPGALQRCLDWIFGVHFLEPVWKLTSFSFVGAIELVVFTFVMGYLFGLVFALAWNWMHKK